MAKKILGKDHRYLKSRISITEVLILIIIRSHKTLDNKNSISLEDTLMTLGSLEDTLMTLGNLEDTLMTLDNKNSISLQDTLITGNEKDTI